MASMTEKELLLLSDSLHNADYLQLGGPLPPPELIASTRFSLFVETDGFMDKPDKYLHCRRHTLNSVGPNRGLNEAMSCLLETLSARDFSVILAFGDEYAECMIHWIRPTYYEDVLMFLYKCTRKDLMETLVRKQHLPLVTVGELVRVG